MTIHHIDRALPTAGHTPMYNMHKFFARKQEDVIREYIKNYTEEDEIVLDPFCGSGVMIGEALRLGRKAIGVDINPVAIFITKNTIKYISPSKIRDEFIKIKADIGKEINSLYLTKCRQCKNTIVPAICFTWDNGTLDDIRYDCPHHGRTIDPVNKKDLQLYSEIENGKIKEFFDKKGTCKYWYPTNRFYYEDESPFKEKQQYESVDNLFTKRNVVALAKLYDRIEKIEDIDLQETFKFAFSSLTHLSSRMMPVRPTRPFSSGWTEHSYWYADTFMESNIWNLFERAVTERQSLISAKEDLPNGFKLKKQATKFEQLEKGTRHHYLLAQSAIDALEELGENKVDYVITDPPYGHSIQYAELLFMWGCWLKLMDNFNEIVGGEIIENSKQGKNIEEYEHMLYVAFRKIFKVLKPERYCTITFHNPALKYRNILYRSVVMAGFEFEKIIYQPPPRPSAKSLLQPFGSLEGDYFFRFKKPKIKKKEGYETIDEKRVETLIVRIATEIIADRGEPTDYTFIQNTIDPILYEELRKYGLVMDFQPESVEKILNKHIGKVFQLVDIEMGKRKQKTLLGKGWWFVDPNKYRLDIPLKKRVDEAIVNLLRKRRTVTFTEALTEAYTRFQNSLTPEEHTIMDILKENAEPIKGGKWKIKPFVESIQEKHEEMIFYLAELGIKGGYKVDIATDEYGKSFDKKKLSSILKLKKVELVGIDREKLKRISKIDVIWHDDKEIKVEFEVEHSTSFVDAVVRGSNIESSDVKRIMVVPKEREDLAYRRFKEPAMKSMLENMDWKILTYKKLNKYYLDNKSKKEINIESFFKFTRKPISKKQRREENQKKLSIERLDF